MLVLSRKPGEKVVIGRGITVTVLEILSNRIRLGIEAPDDIRILRGELACWLDLNGDQADEPLPEAQPEPERTRQQERPPGR
jgi:carbon storage regulator